MTNRKFVKRKEDFVCLHCGFQVSGDGYTNHCPFCLWSRHVDINPGDRQAECLGMMKPVELLWKEDRPIIIHQCLKCGLLKQNKTQLKDNLCKMIT
ncbi:MAG: RNHCP domain-containing protein [Patescibacteria group bacterium]